MEAVVVVAILLLVGIIFMILAELAARLRRKALEKDYKFLLRFYVSYITCESETGPSAAERENARLSYKRVINAKLHLTREEPPIWGALEQYFGPVWP